MIDLTGSVALVTGAGRGIGKGCALQLARAGATLIINDRTDSPDLSQAAREITELGASCTAIEGDVFTRQGCEQLVAAATQVHGRIDCLVSNPAFSRRQTFLDYDPEVFDQTIQGTLSSGFHMSQLVARHMVERGGGGKIVFISSVQGEMAFQNCVPYCAAKAGLNHMTRSVSIELAAHKINVNAIEPGWIDTPGEHVTFGDDYIEDQGKLLPWGRLGTPEDIGNTAAFLCSSVADYISGEIIAVDGCFRHKDGRIELP